MKTVLLFFLIHSLPLLGQLNYLTKVNQSTTTKSTSSHSMSCQGDNIFVTYKRGSGTSSYDREIKVVVSHDKGKTWIEKDITISNLDTYTPLIIATSSAINVYYEFKDLEGSYKLCVARSTNSGDSFTLNVSEDRNFKDVIDYNDDICSYENIIAISEDEDLFVSNNSGSDFTKGSIPSTSSESRIAISSQYLWVGSFYEGNISIYRSSNLGNTFELIHSFSADLFSSDFFDITSIGNDKILLSWEEEIVGEYFLNSMIISGTNANDVVTIEKAASGIYGDIVVGKSENKLWVSILYGYYDSNLYYSDDDGMSWSKGSDIATENSYDYAYYSDFHPYSDNELFYLSVSGIGNDLKEVVFQNQTWVDYPVCTNLSSDTLITSRSLYLNFDPYVKTINYQLQISKKIDFSEIVIDTLINENYLYVELLNKIDANGTKYFYRLMGINDNYKTNWSLTNSFIYGSKLLTKPILVSPANNSSYTTPDYIPFSWEPISKADRYYIQFSTMPDCSDTLTINNYKYVFITADNSWSWPISFNGPVYWRVRGVEYWTSSSSPWSSIRMFNSIITSVDDKSSMVPDKYSITNYPNPFNPNTIIKYDLPEQSNVQIDIFNILGEKIEILINTVKQAGFYEETWNAENLPSGIYLINFQANGTNSKKRFVQIKKALLLK